MTIDLHLPCNWSASSEFCIPINCNGNTKQVNKEVRMGLVVFGSTCSHLARKLQHGRLIAWCCTFPKAGTPSHEECIVASNWSPMLKRPGGRKAFRDPNMPETILIKEVYARHWVYLSFFFDGVHLAFGILPFPGGATSRLFLVELTLAEWNNVSYLTCVGNCPNAFHTGHEKWPDTGSPIKIKIKASRFYSL